MLEPVGVKGVVVVLIWILVGSGHMVSGAMLTLGLWTPRCPNRDPRGRQAAWLFRHVLERFSPIACGEVKGGSNEVTVPLQQGFELAVAGRIRHSGLGIDGGAERGAARSRG